MIIIIYNKIRAMKSSRTPNTHRTCGCECKRRLLHTERMVQRLKIAHISRAEHYDQVKAIFPSILFVLFSMRFCICADAFVVLMTGAGADRNAHRTVCTTSLVHTERQVESFPPSIFVKAEIICGTMVNIDSSGQRMHGALFKNLNELHTYIQDSS